MIRALTVAFREVRNYLQDAGDLAFSLLLPIATFALIYGAFGGQGLFHGTAYIVNEDPSGIYATKLVDDITAEESLEIQLLTRADAINKLDHSDLNMVLLIPSDFSDRLAAGQGAELTFMQRGNGGQDGQIVASIIRGIISGLNQDFNVQSQVTSLLAGKPVSEERITVATQHFLAREQDAPLVGITEVSVGTKPNTVLDFLPGIVTMYVLFSISIGAATIVDERHKGTLERLLTTRLTVTELFFGKFLASVFRGVVQTFILLALSYAVFRVFTPLTFLEGLFLTLVFVMAASAIGLVVASLSRTRDAATWIGVFVTMSMTMLGGTFFTISQGSFLYTLSKFSLNTYANNAFQALLAEGGKIGDIWYELAVLAGVAVVGIVVSRLLFKAVPGGK